MQIAGLGSGNASNTSDQTISARLRSWWRWISSVDTSSQQGWRFKTATLLLGLITSPANVAALLGERYGLENSAGTLRIIEEGSEHSLAASPHDVMVLWNQRQQEAMSAPTAFLVDIDNEGRLNIPNGRNQTIFSKSKKADLTYPAAIFAGGKYYCNWIAKPPWADNDYNVWFSGICDRAHDRLWCRAVKSFITVNGAIEVTAGLQGIGMTALSSGLFSLAWPQSDGIFSQIFTIDGGSFTAHRRISDLKEDQSVSRDTRQIAMATLGVRMSSSPYVVVWVDHHKDRLSSTVRFRVLAFTVGSHTKSIWFESGPEVKKITDSFLHGIEGLPAVVGIQGGFAVFYRTSRTSIVSRRYDGAGNPIDDDGATVVVKTSRSIPDYFSVVPWRTGYACFWGTKEPPDHHMINTAVSLNGKEWVGGPTVMRVTHAIKSRLQVVSTHDNIFGLWKSESALRLNTFRWSVISAVPTPPAPIVVSLPPSSATDRTIEFVIASGGSFIGGILSTCCAGYARHRWKRRQANRDADGGVD